MNKTCKYLILLGLCTLGLFLANLFWGSVHIPAEVVWKSLLGTAMPEQAGWEYIVVQNRLPQTLTALLCGASLSVSGLLLQTAFRNPLAGPSILGIDSGANLGVALVMLSLGSTLSSFGDYLSLVAAALIGALAVMALLILFASVLKNEIMLLITGIMIGYLTSSGISLLSYASTAEGVHAYMMWGMGNFGGVSFRHMPVFALTTLLGLCGAFTLIKPLNALLLGTHYAHNLGVHIHRTRLLLLLTTGILTAVCTAFCGPISFVGLAVPHLARMLLGTANHRALLPATLLTGCLLTLLCNLLSTLPGESGLIPINVITPVLGAPVVIYVIMKQRW